MFSVKRNGDNRLDIVMSERLDAEGMSEALDRLEQSAEGIEHGCMLYDVVDYHLPSFKAVMIEFGRLPAMMRFIHRFERAAVLTDKRWLAQLSELEGALLPWLTIRAFSHEQREAAEQWLATGECGKTTGPAA